MKHVYYLNEKTLPTIPVPHDCVIKRIQLTDQCIVLIFEDDISYHDSIRHIMPEAKSLIVRYHFADDGNSFSIYQWTASRKPFSKVGYYKCIDNRMLTKIPEGKYKVEYLYHNVGYRSIITKLFANGYIILDAEIDYVEFEWMC